MNRNVKILLAFFALIAAVAYFIVASSFVSTKEETQRCKRFNISIADADERGFVTEEDVKSILVSSGQQLLGAPISSINCYKLEELLRSKSYIKFVEVYTDINGTLNVSIAQREPVLRVCIGATGFYLDKDGYVFPPSSSYAEYVPVVTGAPQLPFTMGYKGPLPLDPASKQLVGLLDFALFLKKEPYWNAMIVQINVTSDGKVELIPRVGSQVVILGSLDGYEYKLHKLQVFYRKAMPTVGWNTYKIINLSYGNQVVCK